MDISLNHVMPIERPDQYKLHLACNNGKEEPLNVFVRSKDEWHGWNSWRGPDNDWTRAYIFSLIDFYHEKGKWLFGGIFKVVERLPDRYRLELVGTHQHFIGRLILSFHRRSTMRGRDFYLEKHYNDFVVSEILRECYSGERFPGYENINHDFSQLEMIFRNGLLDWKTALGNVKGVYLIVDKSNGKKYVGSAYNETGPIWARWQCYISSGHGGNVELRALIDREGVDYARKNFKFSILE
jgi:hypothetical protein